MAYSIWRKKEAVPNFEKKTILENSVLTIYTFIRPHTETIIDHTQLEHTPRHSQIKITIVEQG